MSKFLDLGTIKTVFTFTDYFIKNKKSINDIVKYTLTDDDIDYEQVPLIRKQINGVETTPSSKVNTLVFSDNTNLNGVEYVIRTNGYFDESVDNNNSDIFVTDGTYVEFEFTSESEFFVEFLNKNFIKSIKIDGATIDNFKNNYIYIKKRIKIYFNNVISNGFVNVFSVKRRLYMKFNITYTFTGNKIKPEIDTDSVEYSKFIRTESEMKQLREISGVIVDDVVSDDIVPETKKDEQI